MGQLSMMCGRVPIPSITVCAPWHIHGRCSVGQVDRILAKLVPVNWCPVGLGEPNVVTGLYKIPVCAWVLGNPTESCRGQRSDLQDALPGRLSAFAAGAHQIFVRRVVRAAACLCLVVSFSLCSPGRLQTESNPTHHLCLSGPCLTTPSSMMGSLKADLHGGEVALPEECLPPAPFLLVHAAAV